MGSNPATQPILCWFCGADLVYGTSESGLSHISSSPSLVEKPYLAALLGVSPEPALLGQVNAQQFRCFVDDMFQLFSWYPDPQHLPRKGNRKATVPLPRREMLTTIAEFILNASPVPDVRQRQSRYRKSLRLWTSVFMVLPRTEGELLERASRLWPPALRRRFASALIPQTRKRRPYSPFSGRSFRPGLEYTDALEFRDLSAVNQPISLNSGI
jgi:hypothetical protein